MFGPKFQIQVHETDATMRVALSGELDISTVGDLASALAITSGKQLIVDLTEVTFMDTSGLGVFVGLKLDHPDLELVTNSTVDRLLDVTHLREHFNVGESRIG